MISLQIKSTKQIMSSLLMSEFFDEYYVEDVILTTYNTFQIDGHVVPEYFTADEVDALPESKLPAYSKWKDIRPICFQLIKGKKTPVSFRFILHANEQLIYDLCNSPEVAIDSSIVKGLVLNIRYEQGKVSVITATSYHSFIMDKSLDQAWDKYLPALLSKLQIDFEQQ